MNLNVANVRYPTEKAGTTQEARNHSIRAVARIRLGYLRIVFKVNNSELQVYKENN